MIMYKSLPTGLIRAKKNLSGAALEGMRVRVLEGPKTHFEMKSETVSRIPAFCLPSGILSARYLTNEIPQYRGLHPRRDLAARPLPGTPFNEE